MFAKEILYNLLAIIADVILVINQYQLVKINQSLKLRSVASDMCKYY